MTKSSINGSTNFYPESETTENPTKSEFESKAWASLTNTPTMGRRQPRPVSIPVAPPAPQWGARLNSEKNDRNWEGGSQSTDTDNVFVSMSGSPGRVRARVQGNGEVPRGRRPTRGEDGGDKPRTSSFTNNGYEGENGHGRSPPRGRRQTRQQNDASDEESGGRGNKAGSGNVGHDGMLSELKRELSRRQSMREGKENGEETEKKETLIDDPPGAPTSKSSPKRGRRNKDGKVPELEGDIDKRKYLAMDQQSEIGDGDRIENPLLRNDPNIRASVSSLRSRPDDSPGTKKRRRKKKKYVGVHKEPANKDGLDNSADTLPDPPSDSFDSIPPHTNANIDNLPLPPEALAPVFATDQATMQHFYPYAQDQNGYQQQMVPVLVGYDAQGNPVYNYVNPQMLNAPYMQGGYEGALQQYDPNYVPGYYMDAAGNYIPLGDTSHPGMPGFTSTPGHDPQQYGQSPYHGRRHRKHPGGALSPAGVPYNSIVPAGTILDDPQVPPPGGTMVRSAVDPATGTVF